MKKKEFTILAGILFLLSFPVNAQEWHPENHAVITSDRADGRFLSTYGVVHSMLKKAQPSLAYKEGMSKKEFRRWQREMSIAMKTIMNFPVVPEQPAPRCISTTEKDGYTLEKWEFYPLPDCVSTFLVLKPQGIQQKTPAVLCIPGSGGAKEGLAGEPGASPKLTENYQDSRLTMALNFVKAGYVAVAVDNAASGEASDLERYDKGRNYDYDVTSRILLELGWSWLGYTSYLDMQVLNWMKEQPYINRKRIIVSGFSLGTEPMMVLGVLDKEIFAFAYNDFLCQTQERAIAMTRPKADGRRPFPNSIRHLIPNYWKYFNFPDVVAALAPRPVILTEGGLDRDFAKLQDAYRVTGHPENLQYHHYPKFADKAQRQDIQQMPEGIDAAEFFRLANVDPPMHYFKSELIIPWLKKIIPNHMHGYPSK